MVARPILRLTACKGIGQSIGGASDDVGRATAKANKVHSPAKVPPLSHQTQRPYRVVTVRRSADELIASLDTANGLYLIYVDCRSSVITQGQVPAPEAANVIRDVCSATAGTPDDPNNPPVTPSLPPSVDPAIAAKEQA